MEFELAVIALLSPGTSLLVEINSLFLITGNLSLRPRKGFEISALDPPGGGSFDEFPCIFPVDQGIDSRDEFAPDSFHRHLVCRRRDFSVRARGGRENRAIPQGFGTRAFANAPAATLALVAAVDDARPANLAGTTPSYRTLTARRTTRPSLWRS